MTTPKTTRLSHRKQRKTSEVGYRQLREDLEKGIAYFWNNRLRLKKVRTT